MGSAEEKWVVEEEEEEEAGLQGRQSRHLDEDATDATHFVFESSKAIMSKSSSSTGIESGIEEDGNGELEKNNGGTDGEGENETTLQKNSVYFDKEEGIWKCHHCEWTYRNGNHLVIHIQDVMGHSHTTMNVETLNQQGPCLISEPKGTESTNEFSGTKYGGVEQFVNEISTGDEELDVAVNKFDVQTNLSNKINQQQEENLHEENFSSLSVTPLKKTTEIENKNFKNENETSIDADVELIEEIDQEVIDLDVEGLLKKQNTHDLYCPNCNSCITRKVILRKRKWKFQNVPRKERREILEKEGDSELDVNPAYAADGQDHGGLTTAAKDNSRDREPDIFRCLSCLSFFIPAGSCFKLFPSFGDSNETENPEKKTSVNPNWFLSLFASTRKTATDPGDAAPALNDGSALPERSQIQMDPKSDIDAIVNKIPVKKGDAILMLGTLLPAESFWKGGLVNNATTKSREPQADSGFSPIQGSTLVEKMKTDVGQKPVDVLKNNTGDTSPVHIGATNVIWCNLPGSSDDMPRHEGTDGPAAQLVNGSAMSKQSQKQMDPKYDGEAIANELPVKNGEATLIPGSPLPTETLWKVGLLHNESTMPQEPGIDTGFSLIQGPTLVEKAKTDGEAIANELPVKNGKATLIPGSPLPTETLWKGGLLHNESTMAQEPGIDSGFSLIQGPTLVEKAKTDAGKKPNTAMQNNTGDSVVIILEKGSVEPTPSEREQNIDDSLETGLLTPTQGEQRGAGASETFEWDILKSIVYGGLIESITSLGVVSSAAGAGSSTLNILALGLANLIGGLFIVGHNLIDLRNDHSGESSNQSNGQEGKYHEQLGRKENFLRHVIAVILSYLIFGMLPPVIYSFSFRKSDNRDLKLAVVASSSLLCIILLAIGKAHIQMRTRSYIKTVLIYVGIGIMSSGISYVIGDLIDKFLEKVGLFESSLAATASFPQIRPIERAWASY